MLLKDPDYLDYDCYAPSNRDLQQLTVNQLHMYLPSEVSAKKGRESTRDMEQFHGFGVTL